ncbi:hypothetical protein AQUCO_02700353v1 [Aquilegia coerulea]|uniref:Metallothionein-like protein n=1 Tax=Aquilegia coerulea TaxID=218851 RepID=A0A2G5D6G9_AQUCA|nr:hypothetical protein AQUCO_02700353v1 [Aquilegia coerulea]
MSSCCNGNCGCGSGCKCGSSCTGCKRNSDLSYLGEKTSGETMVFGLAPEKAYFEGSEMGVGAENDGCKCGPNCTCNPCTCK